MPKKIDQKEIEIVEKLVKKHSGEFTAKQLFDKYLDVVDDGRPVKCYICGKKLYYLGHTKFEEEYKIMDEVRLVGYVHAKCVKLKKKEKKE